MRRSLLSLLLLTVAAPAPAQPVSEERTQEAEVREAPRERFERPQRAAREFNSDSEARRVRPERTERVERTERFGGREAATRATGAAVPEQWRRPSAGEAGEPARNVTRAAAQQSRRERTGGERHRGSRDSARGWTWRESDGERRGRTGDVPPSAGSPVFGSTIPTPQTVTRPSRDISAGSVAGRDLRDRIAVEGFRRDRIEREGWRREWREDRRYDWRRHRDRDRARFHLGIYIDPFGSRYHDYDIGWRLPERLYASRYWLADPWAYRLPPVGGPYRWVRYYNDVLLIDLRSGRVLDRIRGFFW